MTIESHQSSPSRQRVMLPALLYFALAFAAGFLLGPVRMFVLSPRVGPVVAVLIEAPFILSASYFIARWVLVRFAADAPAGQRLAIGLLAFVMLMTAELLMSILLGVGAHAFLSSLASPEGSIGLIGQVIFAFVPVLIRRR